MYWLANRCVNRYCASSQHRYAATCVSSKAHLGHLGRFDQFVLLQDSPLVIV